MVGIKVQEARLKVHLVVTVPVCQYYGQNFQQEGIFSKKTS